MWFFHVDSNPIHCVVTYVLYKCGDGIPTHFFGTFKNESRTEIEIYKPEDVGNIIKYKF